MYFKYRGFNISISLDKQYEEFRIKWSCYYGPRYTPTKTLKEATETIDEWLGYKKEM